LPSRVRNHPLKSEHHTWLAPLTWAKGPVPQARRLRRGLRVSP